MATAAQVQEASISSSPPNTPPQVKKLVRKPTAYDTIVHRFLGGDQKVKHSKAEALQSIKPWITFDR